jgi:hypothetical protein
MKKKIKGGFIRFAIMDKEYTHNFSDHDKLGWLEHYVYIGRPEEKTCGKRPDQNTLL